MNKMRLIKVLNPVKAKELELSGFKYTKEFLDKQEIFVFFETPQLLKFIQKEFSKNDFFIDNTMNFTH